MAYEKLWALVGDHDCDKTIEDGHFQELLAESLAYENVLAEWSLTRAQKERKRPVDNSQKWSRSLTGVVVYESF